MIVKQFVQSTLLILRNAYVKTLNHQSREFFSDKIRNQLQASNAADTSRDAKAGERLPRHER
jgi:hypothetical protein